MRGEHCVAGASVLSAISLILLVFVNISQIKPGPVTNGLFFAEVNLDDMTTGINSANVGGPGGVFAKQGDAPLGEQDGARYKYRYGIFGACAYDDEMVGICNTTFAAPYNPYQQIAWDIPQTSQRPMRTVWYNFVDGSGLANENYNNAVSKVASALIFIGSAIAVIALVVGAIKFRLAFFIASIASGASALLLMIGASMWTAIVARNADVSQGFVSSNKVPVGIKVIPGPALYLTWVAFALEVLAFIPYIISCCTFKRERENLWK